MRIRKLLHKLFGIHTYYTFWQGYPRYSLVFKSLKKCRFCNKTYLEIDDMFAEPRPLSFDINKDYIL